jgi:hypothetical protein
MRNRLAMTHSVTTPRSRTYNALVRRQFHLESASHRGDSRCSLWATLAVYSPVWDPRAPSGHRVKLTAYGACGMIEYTAFRSARSRGSPVSVGPIWLVTYA